jgi:hypothetical protein
MVRDSGNWIGESADTCVARVLSSLSAPMPTTHNDSPREILRSNNFALRTGVVPTSFGS